MQNLLQSLRSLNENLVKGYGKLFETIVFGVLYVKQVLVPADLSAAEKEGERA